MPGVSAGQWGGVDGDGGVPAVCDLLDAAFYSYEMRVAKPDPAYFTTILGRLDEAAECVLFVDDSLRNVEAAREVGLAAEHWAHGDGLDALRDRLAHHGLRVP